MRDNNATRHNAGERQRRLLLAALRRGPVSSVDARERLNIYHPAARVLELRERGHRIVTTWSREADAWGRLHRVGRYVLAHQARRVEA